MEKVMILTGYLCIEGASFLSFFVPSFQQKHWSFIAGQWTEVNIYFYRL